VPSTPSPKRAKHGEKMIEVSVRFWTDDIAGQKELILPRHAWTGGVVRIQRNQAHGIKPSKDVIFNSLLELPFAIEKVLLAERITLHGTSRTRKYIATH